MSDATPLDKGCTVLYRLMAAHEEGDTAAEQLARSQLESVLRESPELEALLCVELPRLHYQLTGIHCPAEPGDPAYPAPPTWRTLRYG